MMLLLSSNQGSHNGDNIPLKELYTADKPRNCCAYVRPCTNMFSNASTTFPYLACGCSRLPLLLSVNICTHLLWYPWMCTEISYENLCTTLLFPFVFVLWNPHVATYALSLLWPIWHLYEFPSPPINILNNGPLWFNLLINTWMNSLHPTNDISSL